MRRGKKLLVVLIVGLFALSAGKIMGETLPEKFSWYGESGATKEPVYDAEKGGFWWMPEEIPAGMENEQWGNRGYVFVGTGKQKVTPIIKEKPVKKIVKSSGKILVMNLQSVCFDYDSAKITAVAAQILKENVAVLKANPTVKVVLVGSASPEGATDYNLKLSERRVNAVKDYLIKAGVNAAQLTTKAVGEIEAAKAEWPFVRRVQFTVVK